MLEGSVLKSGDRIQGTAQLIDAIKGHAILLIIAAREGYDEALLRHTDLTLLELEKLPQKYAQQMLNQVQGQNKLPEKVLDEILERTDGIPLFIEELSKNLMEMELGITARILPHLGFTGVIVA